ncbi:hypothetical protein [Methanoculleus sp.]|uniref:hypothetical protein n=1 Tax=Methanoculleus sp. TaxID=90427 RepID=UPI0025F41DB1|nr:hypothetical protein [Methanoculleus sp.]
MLKLLPSWQSHSPTVALRAKGIGGVEEVRIACIENDGDISALTCRETDRYRAAASAEDGMTPDTLQSAKDISKRAG